MKNRKPEDTVPVEKQDSDEHIMATAPRKMWRTYFQVGFIGLLIIATLLYGLQTSSRITNDFVSLADAGMEISLAVTTAHLWFEEIVAGDRNESIQSVWEHLDSAERYARAMQGSAKTADFTYIAVRDPELQLLIGDVIDNIIIFRSIAQERYGAIQQGGVGSELDRQFDSVFRQLLQKMDLVKTGLRQAIARDIGRFRQIQIALMALCFLLAVAVGLGLHRFERRRTVFVLAVTSANQQLQAGEQQLSAANQQLRAHQQQLKASNQQLSASEQQLKASNQQLKASNQQLSASEQQLKASNQQLSASEQQLKASNQQLSASEQELKATNHSLGERVKELQCMYAVTESIRTRATLDEMFQDVVNSIPPGWQYPEITRGRIIFDKKEFVSEPFSKTAWKQSCEIIVYGEPRGAIEVYYLKKCPGLDDGPFMNEEINLINGIAKTISEAIERKQTEEEIDRVTRRLQTSIEQMPIAYILWDSDGRVIEWNKTAEKIFGYTSEEIIGERFLEKIVPEAVKPLVDTVVSQLFSGEPSSYSEKDNNVNKAGELISCLWYNTPMMDEHGKTIAVLSMTQDVTESLAAEEKLERFAAFPKYNPAPLLRTDLNGRITLANPAAMRLFDTDITGEQIESYMPRIADENGNLIVSETPVQFEQAFGDKICLFTLCRDEATQSLYVFGSDITEVKRLQELESRAERLESAGKISGQIAHDFNNLLAPLMAYPDFIRDQLSKNHPALPYLRSIEESATRIADINQQLLTLGRRGHYNQEVLNLNEILMRVVNEMATQPGKITYDLKLDENLMNVMGGSAQIHRAVSNLLLNAQDAMQDVGRITIKTENLYVDEISVAYGRVPKGEFVKVTISDDGCGISESVIQKIFDPFFTSKVTDKKRGSGLGLSIVDSVMKDHKGYIDLSTKIGQGTSFYLYFPITRAEVAEAQDQQLYAGTETVLVIDDDDLQREVSSKLLTKLGYQVSIAESGEKAIAFLKDKPRDILILDMVMPPGIDGAETYRRIAEFNPGQKAIIVSGFSETERVLEAQKLGAGAFIRKPLTIKAIAAALRTELDRKAGLRDSS